MPKWSLLPRFRKTKKGPKGSAEYESDEENKKSLGSKDSAESLRLQPIDGRQRSPSPPLVAMAEKHAPLTSEPPPFIQVSVDDSETSSLDSTSSSGSALSKRRRFSGSGNNGLQTITEDLSHRKKISPSATPPTVHRASLSLDSANSMKGSALLLHPSAPPRRSSYIFRQQSRASGCSNVSAGSLLAGGAVGTEDHEAITPFAQMATKYRLALKSFEEGHASMKQVFEDITTIKSDEEKAEVEAKFADEIGKMECVMKLLQDCGAEIEEFGKQDHALGEIAAEKFDHLLKEEMSDEPVHGWISDVFTTKKNITKSHEAPSRNRSYSVVAPLHHGPLSPSLFHSHSMPMSSSHSLPRTKGAPTINLDPPRTGKRPHHPSLSPILDLGSSTTSAEDAEPDAADGKTPLAKTFPPVGREVKEMVITDNDLYHRCLEKLDDWDFNIFDMAQATNGQPFLPVVMSLITRRGLLEELEVDKHVMANYLRKIEALYKENPYHNSWHGADVAQTVHMMVSASQLEDYLNPFDLFLLIVTACVHDVAHPGVNNQYLIMTRTEPAPLYNDRSCLENMHASLAMKVAEDEAEGCGILTSFERAERDEFRQRCVDMILATDPSGHVQLLGGFTAFVDRGRSHDISAPCGLKGVDLSNNLPLIMQMLLHSADISNPCKQEEVCRNWTVRIMEEFHNQGDLEREHGFTPNMVMDRNQDVAPIQIGFINGIVRPQWEAWNMFVKHLGHEFNEPLDNLVDNLGMWERERRKINQCESTASTPSRGDDSGKD